jgi:hypothetical protein
MGGRVMVTRRSRGENIMGERVIKATVSGWRPWAIGAAALSMAGAALLLFRWQRNALDTYEEWWRHRDHVRANGHRPPARERSLSGHPDLFV